MMYLGFINTLVSKTNIRPGHNSPVSHIFFISTVIGGEGLFELQSQALAHDALTVDGIHQCLGVSCDEVAGSGCNHGIPVECQDELP